VPIAAIPAARAAFLATRWTFGSRVFFVFAGVLAFVVFLVFDLVRARFEADLAFVRLTLFFMISSLRCNRWRSTLNGGPEPQCRRPCRSSIRGPAASNSSSPSSTESWPRVVRCDLMTRITGVHIERLLPCQGSRTSLRRSHRSRKQKPARTSSSSQRTLSVPVTTRIAGAGPGSPLGPAAPAGPDAPAGL
jgi:hypothetical protein